MIRRIEDVPAGGAGAASSIKSVLGELVFSLSIEGDRVHIKKGEASTFKTSRGKSVFDLLMEHFGKTSGTQGGFSSVFKYTEGSNNYILKRIDKAKYIYNPDSYIPEALNELNCLALFHGTAYVNQVLGAEIYENGAMIVLEFVDGQTLWDWLLTDPQPDEEAKRRRFMEISEAVAHIHSKGLAHMDINPKNIWIPKSRDRRAYLLDLAPMTPFGYERISQTRTEWYYPEPASPIEMNKGNKKVNDYSMAEIEKNMTGVGLQARIRAANEEKERLRRREALRRNSMIAKKAAEAAAAAAATTNGSLGGGARKSRRHRKHSKKRRTMSFRI